MAELTDEQIDVVLQSQPRGYIIDPVWFRAAAHAILALSATGAEDAELRKKAARYDWLRSMIYDDRIIVSPDRMLSGDALDAAIDAARTQSNGAAGGGETER